VSYDQALLRFDPWPGSESVGRFAEAVADGVSIARPEVSAPTVDRQAPWMKPIRDKFGQLAKLRDDSWDGRGSAAVRIDVLKFAWTILSQIMPFDGVAPGIIPLGHGGIQLVWTAPGKELELEIARPHEITGSLFSTLNNNEQEIRADAEHLDALTAIIWHNIRRI
jgi:hypothetical protein